MIDAIVYVADYPALVGHLSIHHRELLARDDNGAIAQPPVVTGFTRTPAVKSGDAVMAYVRLRDEEASRWRGMPGVEVLAEAEYTGKGTADAVYAQVFDDPECLAKYDSVYDRTPREVPDGEGGTITCTPPDRFGIIAGG
ncbi:hypothetical protein [Halomonas caseinilytica]|uniref:hypothetical protein n=1 Tax=Halomonas caseinilytica TaxID=438744 RepID=UPI0007E565C8|nr:hypothetical protein [Halomonas caseinilytica]SEN16943.1 hypothetical protein SAMN04487952_11112 [Halomonas caseinilytica]